MEKRNRRKKVYLIRFNVDSCELETDIITKWKSLNKVREYITNDKGTILEDTKSKVIAYITHGSSYRVALIYYLK